MAAPLAQLPAIHADPNNPAQVHMHLNAAAGNLRGRGVCLPLVFSGMSATVGCIFFALALNAPDAGLAVITGAGALAGASAAVAFAAYAIGCGERNQQVVRVVQSTEDAFRMDEGSEQV